MLFLLGDLNAYTTDAIGWNGRDALWSDTADVNFRSKESACMYKTIDGNGRGFIRLCQTGELLVLDSLSWSGGPALDLSPTRPPTHTEASERKRSTFSATVDLMSRLTASSFHLALQFVANNLGWNSTARGGDESGSVLDNVVASSSVMLGCAPSMSSTMTILSQIIGLSAFHGMVATIAATSGQIQTTAVN